jgi:hypothetical protein
MSGLGAGHVRLGDRTSSWIGPTGLTGVQYRSDQCDRFQHTLGIWFPYITHENYLGFEHFGFVKITILHPSL